MLHPRCEVEYTSMIWPVSVCLSVRHKSVGVVSNFRRNRAGSRFSTQPIVGLLCRRDEIAEYCYKYVSLLVCVCLSASISQKLHVQSKLHQLFYADCLRPWLGPPMAACNTSYNTGFSWMTPCFAIMKYVAKATPVGCNITAGRRTDLSPVTYILKLTHRWPAPDRERSLVSTIALS